MHCRSHVPSMTTDPGGRAATVGMFMARRLLGLARSLPAAPEAQGSRQGLIQSLGQAVLQG